MHKYPATVIIYRINLHSEIIFFRLNQRTRMTQQRSQNEGLN